jgi:general L-amino acid transport system permease protein
MSTASDIVTRPRRRIHPVRWLRQNLFSSWFNTLLTFVSLGLIYIVLRQTFTWIFLGADWEVVVANLRLFMIGIYPVDQIWRLWLSVAIIVGLLGLSWGLWPHVVRGVAISYTAGLLLLTGIISANLLLATPETRLFSPQTALWLLVCSALIFGGRFVGGRERNLGRTVIISWLVALIFIIYLMHGAGILLPVVPTTQWGGLQLTLVLAVTGILFSFPLGVLLAIGRRSNLPAISLFCTLFIEIVRGVPLITVLFMFQIMLPLFIPGGENIDKVVRAVVAFTIFTSAYIAENVRGGLQAIPKGQFEAADALGLNPVLTMSLIVLPQALRTVIPANVGQFISLFKDTSLVVIAGLLDLLGIARSVVAQSEFLGLYAETLLFVAVVYWIFAYSMTHVSKRLEDVLGVGKR